MKPNDYHVFSYEDAWDLAMKYVLGVDAESMAGGVANNLFMCVGARIEDYVDHFVVYKGEDDDKPITIYFDAREKELMSTETVAPPNKDAFRNHVQALVKGIETCTASLYKLGEPVEGNKIDEDIHAHIRLMRENYEAQLAKITGLPIEKFNLN